MAEGTPEAVQSGATTRPVDVSTTGSAAGYVPQPVTTSPQSSPAGRAPGVGVAALATIGGAAVGVGTGVGTAYALGVLTGVSPVCGAVAGAGFLGYDIYQVATAAGVVPSVRYEHRERP